ncbi:glycosyltransferase family 4 protein [Candidatus Roizmanbacteria bacterium]|nr:glycosyltransferase family 4 protein [Candidatus Roizmanbacteria bacterium]
MKRIVIVEPNHSHEEVLSPLIQLLRCDYNIHVVAPQTLFDIDILSATSEYYHAVPFIKVFPKSRIVRVMGIIHKYFIIRKLVDQIDPVVVLFNSVPTLLDAFLVSFLFRKRLKIQVIHNFQNYFSTVGKLLYRTFDGSLVISEQVYHYVKAHHPDFKGIDYVLPIYFDDFLKAIGSQLPSVSMDVECLKLGVFGSIQDARRNYSGLLDSLKRMHDASGMLRFRIYLVGKAPQWLQDEIKSNGLEHVVEIYQTFVPFRKMFEILAEMDIVLFLIDNHVHNAQYYNRYKITGTSTLMKAFKKAGASSTDFPVDDLLVDCCYFYQSVDIGNFLSRINNGEISLADIQCKVVKYGQEQEFCFSTQQARLVSMIQRVTGIV